MNYLEMKKGAVRPSKSESTSACATKIRSSNYSSVQQKSKGLTTVLNRKTKSFQALENSNTNKSSRSSGASAKSFLEKKSSLTESLSKYKLEDMTPKQLHESLLRVEENAAQPFTFLNKILNQKSADVYVSIDRNKPTEIDLQLAALKRRVQLNQSLLKRTNEHVKEINFVVERNSTMASRELNYDEINLERKTASGDGVADSDFAPKTYCPGIEELQRTIKATKDMLGYVKKICNEEMKITDLPRELVSHMAVQEGPKDIIQTHHLKEEKGAAVKSK